MGSDDDFCALLLIYAHVGGSAVLARGPESWTVVALEILCPDHCWCCFVASFSGSSEFLDTNFLKVDGDLCIEALHTGLSIARSSNSLGLMWHHRRFAFTVSLYLSLGRPWFRLPSWSSPYIRRLGIRNFSMRMTCPPDAGRVGTVQYLQVGNSVLPADT